MIVYIAYCTFFEIIVGVTDSIEKAENIISNVIEQEYPNLDRLEDFSILEHEVQ